jgi:oxygen-independent coproporphyrinogen-3 oxidase
MSGLYVHIPFCAKRCAYCDFYFVTNDGLKVKFIAALKTEIADKAETYAAEPVQTLYLGGGTPSLLTGLEVEDILNSLAASFKIDAEAEVTLEANPENVTTERAASWKAAGITRISLGTQSFSDAKLSRLTRTHTAAENFAAYQVLRKYFSNLSLDLIFGVQDETPEDWQRDLKTALDLNPQHLSTYSLTVELGTPLFRLIERKKVPPVADTLQADLFLDTMATLDAAGFRHYEVSNFAKPDFESKHNRSYWQRKNYLGFGPSAHSYWKTGKAERRWSNARSLQRYLDSPTSSLDLDETLTAEAVLDEYIFLGLRQPAGLDLTTLQQATGFDLAAHHAAELVVLQAEGLMTLEKNRLCLTPKGFTLADDVAARLLS